MKKNKFQFFLITLFFVFSCKNTTTNTQQTNNKTRDKLIEQTELENETVNLTDDDFGEIIELKGKPQKLDAIIQPKEIGMLIKNDLLIIANPLIGNNLIKIFSLVNFKLVKSVGVKGSGPGEFNSPYLVATDEKDKICYIYDYPSGDLFYLKTDISLFKCNFKFPKGNERASSLKQIQVLSNRNMLYVSASAKGKKIFSFKPDSVVPENELLDLALEKKYNNWAAYIGSFGVNKNKDRMVFAYKYFREIKFLNLNATKEKKLIFDYKKNKSGNAVTMLAPTNISYYWTMSQTNEHIYFSYNGITPVDWVRRAKKGIEFSTIEEYSWDGEPMRRFKLDHAGYFCVDEKRNKLYLIATNAEEAFYIYDLPKK